MVRASSIAAVLPLLPSPPLLLPVGAPDVAKGRPDVARLALQAEPLEHAAEAVGQPTVKLGVDRGLGGGLAFHALASDRDGCGTARELALTFTEQVRATEVVRDLGQHVTEAPRPSGVARIDDVQPFAIGDGAAVA